MTDSQGEIHELEKVVQALLTNQAYFGPAFGAGQLNPVREASAAA
jgi:hypothetical protein